MGRWQIRCYWSDIGTGRARDCSRLNDARFNAEAMYQVSGGGSSWAPWSVYLNGSYRLYLDDARRAVADVTGNPSAYVPLGDTGGRQPAPVNRTPKVLLRNLWRLTIGGWVRVGESDNPAVRDAWSKADQELFRAEP